MTASSSPLWSIVFMCFNESSTLEDGVRRALVTAKAQGWRHEVVIVDDGSTDGSRQIAERLARERPEVRVIAHERNRGIGSVLREGYAGSKGDVVVVLPADLQFAPEDLALAAPALEGADVVNVCRERRHDPVLRKAMSGVERLLTLALFGLDVGDLHWIKIYRRSVLDRVRLVSETSLVDTELLVKARAGGAVVKSVSLPHHPRRAGQSHALGRGVLARSILDLFRLRLALWTAGETKFSQGFPKL